MTSAVLETLVIITWPQFLSKHQQAGLHKQDWLQQLPTSKIKAKMWMRQNWKGGGTEVRQRCHTKTTKNYPTLCNYYY